MDAEFIGHEPCPACGSNDNLARYTDGHGFCFGCEYFEKGEHDGKEATGPAGVVVGTSGSGGTLGGGVHVGGGSGRSSAVGSRSLIDDISIIPLTKRRITQVTAEKFGYGVGKLGGKSVQVAPYRDERGRIVAQKVRFADKDFTILGDMRAALPLWGQQLWRDGGKKVVITEGEIDAMSLSQQQGNKWPVVSVRNGASGAARDVKKAMDWLVQFDEVIFLFDMDEPGQEAARKCALLLPPGKGKIAQLPLKDASDMLVAKRGSELIDAVWGAKTHRPDGIVTLSEIAERVRVPVEMGLPWCFDTLTQATYGRRMGELYGLGAGTGIGKTDFLTQQMEYDIVTLKEKVACFMLEQMVEETGKRVAGKHAKRRFHVPNAGWTVEELDTAIADLVAGGQLFLYDNFGCAEWDVIATTMRHLALSEGVRLFYLDHLTALVAGEEDERKALEALMAELGGLVKELNVCVTFVSHLATPEGKPHEEGGRVMIRHFKGSRAIGYWSHFMFGMERSQQSDDENERQTTTFRILKDRYTGQATGTTFLLGYDAEHGLLYEKDDEPDDMFQDQTGAERSDF
jgi:twinkle protein